MKKRVAIIGAGAAGMMCAVTAASPKLAITVFEKNARAGRKILATGNGRCNITNRTVDVAHFHGYHPSFVTHAIRQFGSREVVAFFRKIGMEIREIEDGRMFPASFQASSVVDFLEYACSRRGVSFAFGREILSVQREGSAFLLRDAQGKSERFDAVVLASGSAAMPALGSSDSGYSIAQRLGHRIYPQFPTLVQLVSDDPLCKIVAGVKTEALVRAVVDGEAVSEVRGDLLFTNYGLSGLAILDISRILSAALKKRKKCAVMIDLLPDTSLSALKRDLQKRARAFGDYPPQLMLNAIVHKKLVRLLLTKTGMSKEDKIAGKRVHTLAYTIKNLKISVSDTRGAAGAEAMAGGVDTAQIDHRTMESKVCRGLYLCGEVVDIDGDRGGYNLHWAWASGYLSGKHLAL